MASKTPASKCYRGRSKRCAIVYINCANGIAMSLGTISDSLALLAAKGRRLPDRSCSRRVCIIIRQIVLNPATGVRDARWHVAGPSRSRVEQAVCPRNIQEGRRRKPTMPAAAPGRDRSRNAVRDTCNHCRPPGRRQHHPEIDDAVARERALHRRLAGALGAAGARAHLPRRPRQRRCAVVDRHLPGRAEAGARRGGVDSRARPERRASAGDPVRQQRRARAVRAGGPACRRALGRDLAGLFADVQGFRQAPQHDQAAGTRRDLCFRA